MHLGLECFTFRGDSHSSKFLVICSDIDMLWTATACLFSLTSWHRHISWAHLPEAVCSCGGFGTLEASTHLLHQPGQHGINQFGGIQTDIDDEAPDAQLEENALFLQFQMLVFVLQSKTYSKIYGANMLFHRSGAPGGVCVLKSVLRLGVKVFHQGRA